MDKELKLDMSFVRSESTASATSVSAPYGRTFSRRDGEVVHGYSALADVDLTDTVGDDVLPGPISAVIGAVASVDNALASVWRKVFGVR